METKRCSGAYCKGKEKPLEEFFPAFARCRSCREQHWEIVKRYRTNHPEKRKAYRKAEYARYKVVNPEKLKASVERAGIRMCQRLENDFVFRLHFVAQIRIRLGRKAFPRFGLKHVDLLGCDRQALFRHVKSLWWPGMSEGNFGRTEGHWQMDHIKPISSFDLTSKEQQLACFHYQNIQPLWRADNAQKSSRLDWVPREECVYG